MSATSEMIPYPCWVPDASAVRIRNVASCIARVLITATYIDELAVASPSSPRHETGYSRRWNALDPGFHGDPACPALPVSAQEAAPGRCCSYHRDRTRTTSKAGAANETLQRPPRSRMAR